MSTAGHGCDMHTSRRGSEAALISAFNSSNMAISLRRVPVYHVSYQCWSSQTEPITTTILASFPGSFSLCTSPNCLIRLHHQSVQATSMFFIYSSQCETIPQQLYKPISKFGHVLPMEVSLQQAIRHLPK